MKVAAISEFKAKLAKYLRLVKTGEKIEIQDRGIPVAILSSIKEIKAPSSITHPRKDPAKLASSHFSVRLGNDVDVVSILIQDRRRR